MSNTKTYQFWNRPRGDNIAGDKKTNIYAYKRSQISHLNEKYLEEYDKKTEVSDFIQALLHYTEPSQEDIQGLEAKLKSANRDEDFVEYAKRQKEIFAKRLLKRDLSRAAQKIFAYLLGILKSRFVYNVVPMIKSGADQGQIDAIIHREVLQPVFDELEENVLELTMDEIVGMLFFLTGNCHLYWTHYANI